MIVILQIVVDDRVVGMVGFEQMFQGSRSLLGCCFDVVHLNRRKIHFGMIAASAAQK